MQVAALKCKCVIRSEYVMGVEVYALPYIFCSEANLLKTVYAELKYRANAVHYESVRIRTECVQDDSH